MDAKRFSIDDCDVAVSELTQFIDHVCCESAHFNPDTDRLDKFWFSILQSDRQFQHLWSVVKTCLLLSHGQAGVEREFSINKATMRTNLTERCLISERFVIDHVIRIGGIENFCISPELRLAVANARQKYRLYLEDEQRQKEKDHESEKRKKDEEELEKMSKEKLRMERDISHLQESADKLAFKAETTQNFKFLLESNALRKSIQEKREQLNQICRNISEKQRLVLSL